MLKGNQAEEEKRRKKFELQDSKDQKKWNDLQKLISMHQDHSVDLDKRSSELRVLRHRIAASLEDVRMSQVKVKSEIDKAVI